MNGTDGKDVHVCPAGRFPGRNTGETGLRRSGSAPPRRVQNSCYENLIDGMCCQLPGKISRPPLTKRKNGKEQGSSGRPGCAGSGASAGSRKKVPAVRKIHRQEPGFGQHAGTLPGPWRTAGNAAGQREQECTPGPHRKPGGKTPGGARQKEGQYGKPGGWCLSGRLREDAKAAFQFAETPVGCLLWHGGRTGQI